MDSQKNYTEQRPNTAEFLKSKYLFTATFIASAIALSAFKSELSRSVNLGFTTPSFFTLGLIFILLLGTSAYFFALSLLSPGERYQKYLGKFFIFFANTFYLFGMIFPIGVAIVWLAVSSGAGRYSSSIATGLTIIGSALSLAYSLKTLLDSQEDFVKYHKMLALQNIKLAYHWLEVSDYPNSRKYVRESLELIMVGILQKRRLRVVKGSLPDLVDKALSRSLINEKQASFIKKMAQADQDGKKITKSDIKEAELIVNELALETQATE